MINLELCEYEVKNIIASLEVSIREEYKSCKILYYKNGCYPVYERNKKVKQLEFTLKRLKSSITEQQVPA